MELPHEKIHLPAHMYISLKVENRMWALCLMCAPILGGNTLSMRLGKWNPLKFQWGWLGMSGPHVPARGMGCIGISSKCKPTSQLVLCYRHQGLAISENKSMTLDKLAPTGGA